MTRQYNGPYDLDMLNGELKTRMQEQEMNQSGWRMQRFIKRTVGASNEEKHEPSDQQKCN